MLEQRGRDPFVAGRRGRRSTLSEQAAVATAAANAKISYPGEGGTQWRSRSSTACSPDNELTQSINHERMPVLMSDPADFETWLVSMHVDDSALMAARVSGRAGAEEVLAALASWWA